MAKWSWIERKFSFDYPVEKWPDLLERVRGTPARVEERVRGLSREVLTRRLASGGWSIQQNIGHLLDLEELHMHRVEQILRGEKTLIAADMSNKATNEGNHNSREIGELLRDFRAERMRMVAKFESLGDANWGRFALHPRLQQPMRMVDIAYFTAEHDDYHLGRIGELIRAIPV